MREMIVTVIIVFATVGMCVETFDDQAVSKALQSAYWYYNLEE